MQDQCLDRYPAKALLASSQMNTPVGLVFGKLAGFDVYKRNGNSI